MAVYTDVSDDDLRAFAALYDIGEVLSCKGIAEGVENSNFLLTTERGNFILTLYEKRVIPNEAPARCSEASARPRAAQWKGMIRRGHIPARNVTIAAGRPHS